FHERRRPYRAGEGNGFASGRAIIDPQPPVSVGERVDVAKLNSRHRSTRAKKSLLLARHLAFSRYRKAVRPCPACVVQLLCVADGIRLCGPPRLLCLRRLRVGLALEPSLVARLKLVAELGTNH